MARSSPDVHPRGGARDALGAALVGLVAFVAFWASPAQQLVDSHYSMLLAENVLLHGDLELDRYFWPAVDSRGYPEVPPGSTLPRHVKPIGEHLYHKYPPATSVLSVPIVAVLRAAGLSTIDERGRFDGHAEAAMQRIVASLVCAAACAAFFLTARAWHGHGVAAAIALAGGLATQVWSTASRGTWSHTWLVLLLALALLLLVHAERGGRLRPVLFGVLVSLAFFVRPVAAVQIAPLSLWMLARHGKRALPAVWTGAVLLAAFTAYNQAVFGGPMGDYFVRGGRFGLRYLALGLEAQLVSPSRGLFVYVPLALLVPALLVGRWRRLEQRGLAATALVALVAHVLLVSSYFCWWVGVSYGPRYTTDVVPVLVLLGALGGRAALEAGGLRRRIEVALFVLLAAWGMLLNGAGAISPAGLAWNARPAPLRTERERIFDWSRPQFLTALFPERLEPAAAAPPDGPRGTPAPRGGRRAGR